MKFWGPALSVTSRQELLCSKMVETATCVVEMRPYIQVAHALRDLLELSLLPGSCSAACACATCRSRAGFGHLQSAFSGISSTSHGIGLGAQCVSTPHSVGGVGLSALSVVHLLTGPSPAAASGKRGAPTTRKKTRQMFISVWMPARTQTVQVPAVGKGVRACTRTIP
jgi:hypothetical protein